MVSLPDFTLKIMRNTKDEIVGAKNILKGNPDDAYGVQNGKKDVSDSSENTN